LSKSSDLEKRVVYALPLVVVGVLSLLAKLTATIFIVVLMGGFLFEVVNNLRRNRVPSVKAFWVTITFVIVGLTGFGCALSVRMDKHGLFNLLLVALGVAATDIFAYLGGKKYGRRKLVPRISPNKTVEGLFCGLAAGMVILLAIGGVLRANNGTSLSPSAILLCAILLPPVAVLGDLLESWSKRLLGVKDFGKVLGPHGGIADRFDAMTAGFIVLAVLIRVTS
jgi:CDP-diglyceride synthetase